MEKILCFLLVAGEKPHKQGNLQPPFVWSRLGGHDFASSADKVGNGVGVGVIDVEVEVIVDMYVWGG